MTNALLERYFDTIILIVILMGCLFCLLFFGRRDSLFSESINLYLAGGISGFGIVIPLLKLILNYKAYEQKKKEQRDNKEALLIQSEQLAFGELRKAYLSEKEKIEIKPIDKLGKSKTSNEVMDEIRERICEYFNLIKLDFEHKPETLSIQARYPDVNPYNLQFIGDLVNSDEFDRPRAVHLAMIIATNSLDVNLNPYFERVESLARFLAENFPQSKKAKSDVKDSISTITRNMMYNTLSDSERQIMICRALVHPVPVYKAAGFINQEEIERIFR